LKRNLLPFKEEHLKIRLLIIRSLEISHYQHHQQAQILKLQFLLMGSKDQTFLKYLAFNYLIQNLILKLLHSK